MQGKPPVREYRELFGSLYFYRDETILDMMDWSEGVAFAYSTEDGHMLRHGRIASIQKFMQEATHQFPGWKIGYIHITQRVPVEDLNLILKFENILGFLEKYVPGDAKQIRGCVVET